MDNTKSQAIMAQLGHDFVGTYAGGISLYELFNVSMHDVPISHLPLSGNEIPIDFSTSGESQTRLLLLSSDQVVLFQNKLRLSKYLDFSQERSIDFLLRKKTTLAEPISRFTFYAASAFDGENDATTYLTAVRFVQAFLSLANDGGRGPVSDVDLSNRATESLCKDAARLQHITTTSYIQFDTDGNIDLSREELQEVHCG